MPTSISSHCIRKGLLGVSMCHSFDMKDMVRDPLFWHLEVDVLVPIGYYSKRYWLQYSTCGTAALYWNITFVQTRSLESLCFIRYTFPKDPSPRTLMGSYSSMVKGFRTVLLPHWPRRRTSAQTGHASQVCTLCLVCIHDPTDTTNTQQYSILGTGYRCWALVLIVQIIPLLSTPSTCAA